MPDRLPKVLINIVLFFFLIGCSNKTDSAAAPASPPPPVHDGMCQIVDLGEASSAIEKPLPNNQYVALEGMSSPKTLVWQDVKTQQIYFATKIMGAEGRLFYMDTLKTGETPKIKTKFTGTLLLWKHLPEALLMSMKTQFKEQWDVDVDVNTTYILKANEKPVGCN
ncbi:MAG: hypothetical protein JXX14_10220 [Deltaproteobacteria bacterium]|nr:hypothetical protein [Deltaproteobacteria bacterium]